MSISGRAPVISLTGVSYIYPGPPPVVALHPVNLAIYRGDYVAITGPSGSGKSTLLHLIGLLDRPTGGRIEIAGADLTGASEADRTGVRHRAGALPTELSGGERQRIAVARALVDHPELLLCDEPTGNLDSATTSELLGLFDELHGDGVTLLVITHNGRVAERAGRQIAIRDGRLTERTEHDHAGCPA